MERPRLYRKFSEADPQRANEIHAAIEASQKVDMDSEKPICFLDNFSASTVLLPPINEYPDELLTLIRRALVDTDMESDLKQQRVLNWFPKVQELVPILTPNDGNCLTHAISIAVWGVPDEFNTLRRLLNAEMARDYQTKKKYYKRWSAQRKQQNQSCFGTSLQNSLDLEAEFQGVMKHASPQPVSSNAAMPHAFLEPIHIYVLANILRRPIVVVADSSARSLGGACLQESDVGGIYLPLEWQHSQCRRLPVVLGYNLNHFTPLLGQEVLDPSRQLSKLAVPVQQADLSFLPVKFAMAEEERNIQVLLNRYLTLKEVPTSAPGDGSVSLVVVASMDGPTPQLDMVRPYFENCEWQYQAFNLAYAGNRTATTPASPASPRPPRSPVPPTLPQAPVRPRMEQAVVHPSNEAYYNAGEETRVTGSAPQPAAREMAAVQTVGGRGGLGAGAEVQSMLFRGSECITPGCTYYASQATGMKCSKCLEKMTIEEAQQNRSRLQNLQLHSPLSVGAPPSAPEPSFRLESPVSGMSMMDQNCRNRCGYRCSTRTFPYCHECAENIWSQRQVPPTAPPAPPSEPLQSPAAVEQGSPRHRPAQQQSEEELFGAGQTRPADLPRPLGAPSPAGSGLGSPLDRCSTPGCSRQGAPNCEGKCISCYVRGTPTVRVAANAAAGRVQSQSSFNSEVAQVLGGATGPAGNVPQAFTAAPPHSPARGSATTAAAPGGELLPSERIPDALKSICATPGCGGLRMRNKHGLCYDCMKRNALPLAGQPETQGPAQGLTEMSLEQRPGSPDDLIESGNSYFCGPREDPSSSGANKQSGSRKCAGPACNAYVYQRELCDNCIAVLQQYQAQHRGRDALPQRQVSAPETQQAASAGKKPGHCSTPNCSFYGAPENGGLCSACYKKRGRAVNQTAPVLRNHPIQVLPPRNSTAPVAKGQLCIVEGCTRYGDPSFDHMCTKCWHYNRTRVMKQQAEAIRHRPVQASLDPEISQNNSFPPYPPLSQPAAPVPSRSPSADEESISFLRRVEDRNRVKQRCKQRHFRCGNYGNPQNSGLCNSCYKSRREELLALEQHG